MGKKEIKYSEIGEMTSLQLAQYIIDELSKDHPHIPRGKVVEVRKEKGPFEATILLENGKKLTVTGAFAAALDRAMPVGER